MKIIVFIYSLDCGGAERMAVSLANYWQSSGHDVTVVTIAGEEKDFYHLSPNVDRISLCMAEESKNFVHSLSNNLRRVTAFRNILKTHGPDVAISVMTSTTCLLALAGLKTFVPIIGSEQIHPPAYPLSRIWEYLRYFSYGFVDAIVCLTEQSSQWIRKNTRAKKVHVIPNPILYPIPDQPPCLSPQDLLSSDKKYLLAVGRLTYQKGFDILIDIFASLAHDFPDWNLVILGEGEDRPVLEELIAERGIQERVLLPGRVGNMGSWYRAADLYVMTSRYEGFGNTLAEALAHGLPAVSVDCETGPRDIIRHQVDGLLVPQNDLDSLKQAMSQLMRDEQFRQSLGERAREARTRFSVENVAQTWEKVFAEVIPS